MTRVRLSAAYHSLDLGLNRPVSFEKEAWDSVADERLKARPTLCLSRFPLPASLCAARKLREQPTAARGGLQRSRVSGSVHAQSVICC